ncbi:MAG: glycosyltransferase [Bryobacterales bacterium]
MESSAPALSIVVSTFGRERLLVDCIESIVAQRFCEWELIVVDQDPSQKTRAVLERRFPDESRLKYFNMPRAGLSGARNKGLEQASSDLIAFLDDDTVATPGWLEAIVSTFHAHPDAGMLCGRIRPQLEGDFPKWFPESKRYLLGLYDEGDRPRQMQPGHLPVGANMAVRREVALAVGGFDPAFGFNYFRRRSRLAGEDSMLGLQVLDAGYKHFYAPQATVLHAIGPAKLTRRSFLARHFWEGVTSMEILTARGKAPVGMGLLFEHLREIGMALGRFVLPHYGRWYDMDAGRIRMLALGRIAYSSGVIYGSSFPSAKGERK